MNILVVHSTKYDYQDGLYLPISSSRLATKYHIEFPHINGRTDFDSRDYIEKEADLVILEATIESAGAWMEAGIAIGQKVPFGVIAKKGTKLKPYLSRYSILIAEYSTIEEMISGIEDIIKEALKQHNI